MSILETILENKKAEVAADKKRVGIADFGGFEYFSRKCISPKALFLKNKTSLICEFKRKSPSKGDIAPNASPETQIPQYIKGGAAALSVLTDNVFFGGSANDLLCARKLANIPILRKDFVVDEYQIYQAKALGADFVLLIAAALSKTQCKDYADIAHGLGMEVLTELHDVSEIEKLPDSSDLAGVNNRNLANFKCSFQNAKDLVNLIGRNFVKVAESSIKTPEDIRELKNAGFSAFLIGETLMCSQNPAQTIAEFLKE